ncbi:hypothetical protein PsorP6_015929 [Peronosclerospora sorghi]|uniref:Uncharacterized protein n=1 Tax=Peronosclerospora sorghi TaxID=230839 RepID=A0ACC0WN03_9STRA|nr:hypothetical protein PsorP6_015929 [Peronosclerospora sorghi]
MSAEHVAKLMMRASALWRNFTISFASGTTLPSMPECFPRKQRTRKLGRSPGLNLVRDERSSLCIFACVDKKADRAEEKDNEKCDQPDLPRLANFRIDEFSRSPVIMEVDLLPGESRGYWKYHSLKKWFKQTKASGKINNERSTLLFDSGAKVSIIDSTFARKVGCQIDTIQAQESVGIGESTYLTEGRTRIKLTLEGSLVYYFHAWVGKLVGQDVILGMDVLIPVGARLDVAHGALNLPDELIIPLEGRRLLYGLSGNYIKIDQYEHIPVGRSA